MASVSVSELGTINSVMQPENDYLWFSHPTLVQKVSSIIFLFKKANIVIQKNKLLLNIM